MDIRPVQQQAPSTSSQPSLAHHVSASGEAPDGTHRKAWLSKVRIMSPRQLSRYPLQSQNTYQPQYYGPSQYAIAYIKTHARDRRTTPRPSKRTDVHVRRQQPPNPNPIKLGRVPPTHSTHYDPTSKPHYKTDFKTQLGQYVFKL
jgi:hypothetical protein